MVNHKIEIDWMLDQYRASKNYKDRLAEYQADRDLRQAIVRELSERQSEWNSGTIQYRKQARAAIIKEIRAREVQA